MKFDIIILTFNRPKLLKECIHSIIENDSPNLVNIFVVNNGEPLERGELADSKKIKFLETNNLYPGAARNSAIKSVTSDFILFLDDDVIIPKNYFAKALSIIDETKSLEVLGGPDMAYPHSNNFQKALDIALKSPLTTGHTFYRHSPGKSALEIGDESKLILCHLWFKSKLFLNENFYFPTDVDRNEENILLSKLKNEGKDIYYSSLLSVHHYRKTNFKDLANVTLKSAQNRRRSLVKQLCPHNILFYIPSLFVFYLCSLLFFRNEALLWPLGLYLLLSILSRLKYLKYPHLALYSIVIQFYINCLYGIGFVFLPNSPQGSFADSKKMR